MKVKSEEQIKKWMEGIYEEDLQRRLKDYYKEREIYSGEQLNERQRINKENNELSIEVYERELPGYVVERARRSAGIYKTKEENEKSIEREKNSLSRNDDELDR